MPNIPFIQHNRNAATAQIRRTQRTFKNDDSAASSYIKRRLDRRKRTERRQKETLVIFDRRQRGIQRRKKALLNTNTINLNATIGKHVNTTA